MTEPRPRRSRHPYAPPRWCERLYVRLAPRQVALLRFLLEAQGHLGVMTVVDRRAAVARLNFPPGVRQDVVDFLERSREIVDFQLIRVPGPC